MDYRFKPSWKKSPFPERRRKQLEPINADSIPPVHDNKQLREADAKLKEYIGSHSCVEPVGFGLYVLMGFYACCMSIFLGEVVFGTTVVVMLVSLITYKHYALKSFARQISSRGSTAGVLYKIVLGSEELGKIYSYVPIPWCWLFLMLKPKKVSDWVLLVAQNLDWYQQEPKFYLPTRWIIQTVLGVIAAYFMAMFMLGVPTNFNGPTHIYWFVAYSALMILVGLGNKMKLAGAIELRAELQSVLPPGKRIPLKAEDI